MKFKNKVSVNAWTSSKHILIKHHVISNTRRFVKTDYEKVNPQWSGAENRTGSFTSLAPYHHFRGSGVTAGKIQSMDWKVL